jgi:hypothetical protein
MQTRIEITITDEDKDKLFDKQLEAIDELSMVLDSLPFPATMQVFDREPEIEILRPSQP